MRATGRNLHMSLKRGGGGGLEGYKGQPAHEFEEGREEGGGLRATGGNLHIHTLCCISFFSRTSRTCFCFSSLRELQTQMNRF